MHDEEVLLKFKLGQENEVDFIFSKNLATCYHLVWLKLRDDCLVMTNLGCT